MVLLTTNISLKSTILPLIRSTSDSKKPSVENAQQVELRFWSFTGVIATLSTVVNFQPSSTFAVSTAVLSSINAAINVSNIIILFGEFH